MKLYVRNKIFSLGGGSTVKDEQKNDVYKVKGKVFSPTHKKKIYNLKNEHLFTVRNKFWHWLTRRAFIFNAQGEKIATLSNNTYSRKFIVEDYVDEIEIIGHAFQFGLSVKKGEQEIGTITRQLTFIGDAFVCETDDEQLMPFLVALTIALDNIVDDKVKDLDK